MANRIPSARWSGAALLIAFLGGCSSPAPPLVGPEETDVLQWDLLSGRLAYVRVLCEPFSCRHQLIVADAASRSARVIRESADPLGGVAWSPEGDRLAFVERVGGWYQIHVIDASGGEPVRLFPHEANQSELAWSAEGRIAHISSGAALFSPIELRIDGESVPAPGLSGHIRPAWPSGSSHVLLSTSGSRVLSLLRLSDGVMAPLIEVTGRAVDPIYSRGGVRLAFVHITSVQSDRGEGDVWMAESDGRDLRQLTSGHPDRRPTWSPDGLRLAFVRDHQLFVINADGSGIAQIRQGPGTVDDVAWAP
jgi:Tol biopolymer transport system component